LLEYKLIREENSCFLENVRFPRKFNATINGWLVIGV